jgi:hypothetical protein
MESFIGAVLKLIVRNRFSKKFMVINDGRIKEEVEERSLGL